MHVGAHPDGHQHAVPYKSINLGKKFLRISCIRKIIVTSILASMLTFSLFSDSGLNILNSLDFYFEWRDTENQQY